MFATAAKRSNTNPTPFIYQNNAEYLEDELHRLDRLLALQMHRQKREAGSAAFPGLVLSAAEIACLLERGGGTDADIDPWENQARQELRYHEEAIRHRVLLSQEAGIELALPRLATLFDL